MQKKKFLAKILFSSVLLVIFGSCSSLDSVSSQREGEKWSLEDLMFYLQKNIPSLTYEKISRWNEQNMPFEAFLNLYQNSKRVYIISQNSNSEAIKYVNDNNRYRLYDDYIFVWGRFCFIAEPEGMGSVLLNIIDETLNKDLYNIKSNPFIGKWTLRFNIPISFTFSEGKYIMEGFPRLDPNFVERPYWYTKSFIYMWFGDSGPYLMKYNIIDNKLLILELDNEDIKRREEIRLDKM
jgi:hypothetical protein